MTSECESTTVVNRKLLNPLPEGVLMHVPGHEDPMKGLFMWKGLSIANENAISQLSSVKCKLKPLLAILALR